MTEAYTAAYRYLQGGLSVLPIVDTGTKAPWLSSWKHLQQQCADLDTVRAWYRLHPAAGVGIIAGKVSGNLEILDFDEPEAWEQWREVALSLVREAGVLLPQLPLVCTPTGGRHLPYRHTGTPMGNTKLAVRRAGDRLETVIETRGEGGYIVAPGSPAQCHPAGRPYVLLQGDLAHIPTISAVARALLLDAARTLSAVPDEPARTVPQPRLSSGTQPGDLYNARAGWDDLLRRHGWRKVGAQGGKGLWRRPGKEQGISATTDYAGSGYLYVWSTNAQPFEAGRGYSLFGAYGLLEHSGDYAAAAMALANAGYTLPRSRGQVVVRHGMVMQVADAAAFAVSLRREAAWWQT